MFSNKLKVSGAFTVLAAAASNIHFNTFFVAAFVVGTVVMFRIYTSDPKNDHRN